MIVGYVRVSTIEQNEGRQLVTMEKYQVEKVFNEKVSAKDTNRKELANMLDFVREGDTIVIHDFSRISRSTKDLLEIVELLENKKVNLVSSKENIDSNTPTGKLMLTMIGAINEFERTNMLERQREGIAIAKAKGKYKGGQVKKIECNKFEEVYKRYLNRKINKVDMANELGVSRPTLNKLIKEYIEVNTDTIKTNTSDIEAVTTHTKDNDNEEEIRKLKSLHNDYINRKITKVEMAKKLNVNRSKLDKKIELYIK